MKESLAMLLKTNTEEMAENRSLAMLMKTDTLKSLSGDVYENKWGYGRCWVSGGRSEVSGPRHGIAIRKSAIENYRRARLQR